MWDKLKHAEGVVLEARDWNTALILLMKHSHLWCLFKELYVVYVHCLLKPDRILTK